MRLDRPFLNLVLLILTFLPLRPWAATYVWPISGTTTPDPLHTSFGPRMNYSKWDFHDGMDLPAPRGTTVVATANSTIFLVGPGGTDSYSSRHVVLKIVEAGGNTLYATYMHLEWSLAGLFVGQAVNQGDILGGVGDDDATYTHLHFEIRRNSPFEVASIHPLHYLPYTDTPNFVSPYAATFNVMNHAMAARLEFSAPDREEGDLALVEVDVKQGSTVLQTRVVNVDDKTTVQEGNDDLVQWTNDISLEGYQWSNMTQQGWNDLSYGVLLRNLPPAADNLVARVVDIGGNTATSGSFPIPAQTPVSWYEDYNSGSYDPAWTALTSATGTGTTLAISSTAALEGPLGLYSSDLSTSEGGPQVAALERPVPAGRFEWVAQAEVNPTVINLGGNLKDAFPISFFNSGGLCAGALIRDNGTFNEAGILIRKPDLSFGGVLSGITVTAGLARRWTLHVTHVGTRYTTTVLYLDGVEADRWFWDSAAQPMNDLRMGLGYSSKASQAVLYEDANWFKEDTVEFFAGTPTPTASSTPSPTISASPTSTVSPTSTITPSSTFSSTPPSTSLSTPSSSMTQTTSPTPSLSPTASSTSTATPSLTATLILSATPSPTPGTSSPNSGTFILHKHFAAPNPQSGPVYTFTLSASHPAARVTLQVYSPSMLLAAKGEALAGPGSPWQVISFDLPGLANGLYFYRLEVEDSQGQKATGTPGRLYVAR